MKFIGAHSANFGKFWYRGRVQSLRTLGSHFGLEILAERIFWYTDIRSYRASVTEHHTCIRSKL